MAVHDKGSEPDWAPAERLIPEFRKRFDTAMGALQQCRAKNVKTASHPEAGH
jgi:hypothetical protein